MAVPVVVNEVLYFSMFYVQRVNKSELCSSLANFYHEDELFNAKLQLCEVAGAVLSPMDGWSKVTNNKGGPVAHRKSDAAARRIMDADDVVTMLMILDVNNVKLPTYASVDPSRVPPPLTPSAPSNDNSMLELAKSLEAVIKRLDKLECRSQNTTSQSVILSPDEPSSVPPTNPKAPAVDMTHPSGSPFTNTSWAAMAVSGDVAALTTPAVNKSKYTRVGTAANSRLKVVPRHLACFVGRLDPATTEEELSAHLTGQGMKGVVCRKLLPRDGRVFKTSAFKVTCCLESRNLFYDEASWPAGAELRDWVFRSRNGEQ